MLTALLHMVCNNGMDTLTQQQINSDAELIDSLGGPTIVAEMLGFDPEKGVKRVSNWKVRGIPADVRLANLNLFGLPAQQAA